jgi:hypothetical protein
MKITEEINHYETVANLFCENQLKMLHLLIIFFRTIMTNHDGILATTVDKPFMTSAWLFEGAWKRAKVPGALALSDT